MKRVEMNYIAWLEWQDPINHHTLGKDVMIMANEPTALEFDEYIKGWKSRHYLNSLLIYTQKNLKNNEIIKITEKL
nr:MAG TPA: hypothetical protein [Microviridae sp.]